VTKFEFDTTEYEWSHGRKPRGRGSWAFFAQGADTSNAEAAVWAPVGTWSEARRWVRANCEAGVWRAGT